MSEYIYDYTPNKQHRKEPIVRCRDCRFYEETGNCNWFECSSCGLLAEVAPDGFCAWGERRDEQ